MQNIQLSICNIDELKAIITNAVNNAIEEKLQTLTPTKSEEEPLTRQQTAEKLGIALSTLHKYTMAGIIPGYRLGSRVLYKSEEVEQSLLKMNTAKPNTPR